MKSILYSLGILAVLLCFTFQKSLAQANTSLSNLVAPTAVNAELLPGVDNTLNLGSSTKAWKQLYISNAVFMGGSKFISYGNTLGLGITAVGNNALAVNSGGFANTGIGFYSLAATTNGNANAAIGTRSLQANTTGSANMAMGYFSLYSNKTGYSNVAIGVRSMLSSVDGHNQVAIGDSSLFSLNGGNANTAIGSKSMFSNTLGGFNTANGYQNLYSNTFGSNNTAIGYQAMYSNVDGNYNVALGFQSLYSNNSSSYNTGVGFQALYSNTGNAFDNTATGYKSLYSNISGNQNTADEVYALIYNNSGSNNVANGVYALQSNNSGNDNVASGFRASSSNTAGNSNVAIGTYALYNNTEGSNLVAVGDSALYNQGLGAFGFYVNTAVGSKALYSNISGFSNTATGSQALTSNTTGNYNTADGGYALTSNTEGISNTSVGLSSLYNNSTGNSNTAVGFLALYENFTGTNLTGIGQGTDVVMDGLDNSTALGYNAVVTASDQVMLGNTSVNSVQAAGSFVIYSDGRYKKDLKENVPGLEFIKMLRPVTYHYNIHGMNDAMGVNKNRDDKNSKAGGTAKGQDRIMEEAINKKEKILYTGFVAQEVETAAKSLNYDFSGVHTPQNDKDLYGLAYSEFVVPLVKAMQELSAKNDSLQARLDRLEELVKGSSSASSSLSDASLGQNLPNPFTSSTSINYTIPQSFGRARLEVSDMSGRIIKSMVIGSAGRGNMNLDASGLSSGVYNYTLYVDEKMISTKQMVLTK